jgi:hypothetical protein
MLAPLFSFVQVLLLYLSGGEFAWVNYLTKLKKTFTFSDIINLYENTINGGFYICHKKLL